MDSLDTCPLTASRPKRPPVSYYGGKQRLVPHILPLIPPHHQYVEPFAGGAAVFWTKPPSAHEVINDLDGRVVNFYRVMQTRFPALEELIRGTLHSEADYCRAKALLKDEQADPLHRAWAFWVQTNMSFSNKLFGGFAFNQTGGPPANLAGKRNEFEYYKGRLEAVEVFSRDALDLIKCKDSPNTFFYLDPPYVSSECGHYARATPPPTLSVCWGYWRGLRASFC